MNSEEKLKKLHLQLKTLDEQIAQQAGFHLHPFLSALAKHTPPIIPGGIFKYCMQADPLDLINKVCLVQADLLKAKAKRTLNTQDSNRAGMQGLTPRRQTLSYRNPGCGRRTLERPGLHSHAEHGNDADEQLSGAFSAAVCERLGR